MKTYNREMVRDEKTGFYMMRDFRLMESDEMERLADIAAQNDADLMRSAYSVEFGDQIIISKKTSAARTAILDRITAIRAAQAKPRASAKQVQFILASCGHSVHPTQVMSASMGMTCPDCYDRLSA